MRWLHTHADDPLSAGKRWVVEHFQFGISMFDPLGLKSRYTYLVDWRGGLWVNYWTQTVPRLVQNQPASAESSQMRKSLLDNDIISSSVDDFELAASKAGNLHQISNPSMRNASSQPAESEMRPQDIVKQMKKAEKLTLKEQIKQGKTQGSKPGKHFIVLPKGLGQALGGTDKWEQVLIEGVEDEVSAHTGLFIPHQNLDYEGLIDRVKARILDWCENLTRFEERCRIEGSI